MGTYKKGRFTRDEQEFINTNHVHMTVKEMSVRLNRDTRSINNYIARNGLRLMGTVAHKDYAEESLLKSEHWALIEERYSKPEQVMVKKHFSEIVGQFQNDVPYTELLQILDYIHLEVEIHRNAVQKRAILDAVIRLNSQLNKVSSSDVERADELEQLIIAKENALHHIEKSIKDFLQEKQKLASALKGTREHRITRIENSKKTLSGMFADLVSSPEKMRAVGIELERHRLATDAQYDVVMSNLHEYADGQTDPPILNADTASQIEKQEIDSVKEDKGEGYDKTGDN
jgi:hypothetical protein